MCWILIRQRLKPDPSFVVERVTRCVPFFAAAAVQQGEAVRNQKSSSGAAFLIAISARYWRAERTLTGKAMGALVRSGLMSSPPRRV
jgi:hypothetical protein